VKDKVPPSKQRHIGRISKARLQGLQDMDTDTFVSQQSITDTQDQGFHDAADVNLQLQQKQPSKKLKLLI
jgi:hypothetical protein